MRPLNVYVIALCLVNCAGESLKPELDHRSMLEGVGLEGTGLERAELEISGLERVELEKSEQEKLAELDASLHNEKQHLLRTLLAEAQSALSKDDLMTPLTNNAFDWYRRVLALDDSNEEAHLGMKKITDRYLVLAQHAFTEGFVNRAELLLTRALKVSATPADVNRIRGGFKQQQVVNNEFRLSMVDLTARNDKSIAELDELAKKALAIGSRLLIVARNDAEGRWIYKQMRLAVSGHRLRGNIKIGQNPAVRLIDVDT